MPIRFGLLKDFKSADTLLLLSDAVGFSEFASRLATVDLKKASPLDLTTLGWLGNGRIAAELVGADSGSAIELVEDRGFRWHLSASERETVVERLQSLSMGSGRAHH